jgi:hypothetical protein
LARGGRSHPAPVRPLHTKLIPLHNAKWKRDRGLNGRGGIRTHGTLLTYTHFPGVRLKPLGHPSQHRFAAREREPFSNGLRTTGFGEEYGRDSKRTGRDSNSRYRVHRYAGFRDRCLQPLGHLSCSPQLIGRRVLLQPYPVGSSTPRCARKNSCKSAPHSSARTPARTSGR